MRGAFQLLQLWQSKRDVDKQKESVALNVAQTPDRLRRCWQSFKSQFYRCFVYCDPDEHPDGMFGQMLYDGTEPNDHFKLIMGYLGSVFMAGILCVFFIFKHPWSPRYIGTATGVLAMFFAYLMFFRLPRCWFLLMLPELLSSRARAVMLLLIVSWTLVGPALNAQTNLTNTADMMACLQEQVSQEGSNLKSAAKNNLKARMEKFYEAKRQIDDAMNQARESLKSVYTAMVKIGNVINNLYEWLDGLVEFCNREAIVPYENCNFFFSDLYNRCRQGIWYHFCGIWENFRLMSCSWLKLAELLCNLPSYVVDFVKDQIVEGIKKNVEKSLDKLKQQFQYNVEIRRNFSYHETFKSNMSYFRDEAKQHMDNLRSWFQLISTIMDILIWVTLAFMFIKAILYQRKYKQNVRWDNYFVTEFLYEIDRDRIKLNKELALPLTIGESFRFIRASTIWFSTSEKWKIIIPIFTTTSSVLFVAFWISFDYALFVSMSEQYVMLTEEGGVDVPNYFKVHVQGKGAFTDGFRKLLKVFMPQNYDGEDLSKKWQQCVIEPSVPDFMLYEYLYILIGICYVTIFLQVYLARLRHVIASIFFPGQERKRAIELHSQILVARGSWAYFAQKQMANRKQAAQKTIERLAVSVPILGKAIRLFGEETKMCFECHDRIKVEDIEDFRQCDVPTCNETFCTECFYRCSTCQSCGGEKIAHGLLIDYEMPDLAKLPKITKKETKAKAVLDKEQLLIKYYKVAEFAPRKTGSPTSTITVSESGYRSREQSAKSGKFKLKQSKRSPRRIFVKRVIRKPFSRKLAKRLRSSKRWKRAIKISASPKSAKSGITVGYSAISDATLSKSGAKRSAKSSTPSKRGPPMKRIRLNTGFGAIPKKTRSVKRRQGGPHVSKKVLI